MWSLRFWFFTCTAHCSPMCQCPTHPIQIKCIKVSCHSSLPLTGPQNSVPLRVRTQQQSIVPVVLSLFAWLKLLVFILYSCRKHKHFLLYTVTSTLVPKFWKIPKFLVRKPKSAFSCSPCTRKLASEYGYCEIELWPWKGLIKLDFREKASSPTT